MNIYNRLCVLAITVFALAACGDNAMKVQANFDNTQQFRTGTAVYLNDQVIGEVSNVDVNEQGALVTLSLQPEIAAGLSSAAAVVVNRLKEGAPLEIYNRESATAGALQDGQTIKGLDSMVQLGAWMVGDAIQLGSGTLSDYVQSFQDYLQSDDFEQDKATVRKQFDSAREQASGALQQLGEDIEDTAGQLLESEQAAAQAVQELGDELAPVVQELANDSARLAAELERFTESLNQQNNAEQQAGEAFLASLLTTLEKLNQAIDEGLHQNPDAADTSPDASAEPEFKVE